MKTVSKAQKVPTAPKAKQTEKQIAGKREVQTHQEHKAGETTEFQKWIESIPDLPDDGDELVPMTLEINLRPNHWVLLAQAAKRKMESIGFVIEDLLLDRCVDLMNGRR